MKFVGWVAGSGISKTIIMSEAGPAGKCGRELGKLLLLDTVTRDRPWSPQGSKVLHGRWLGGMSQFN